MWCSVCQSDVATEVAADNRRVSCSTCGHLLSGAAGAQSHQEETSASKEPPRTEEARQLLDRWAQSHSFDPYGPPKKGVPDPAAADQSIQHPESTAASVVAGDGQETIDEREFDLSTPGLAETPSVVRHGSIRSGSEAAQSHSAGSAASMTTGQAGRDAKASSEELDRLTNEIMSRVSRLTEARQSAMQGLDPDGSLRGTTTSQLKSTVDTSQTASREAFRPEEEPPGLELSDRDEYEDDETETLDERYVDSLRKKTFRIDQGQPAFSDSHLDSTPAPAAASADPDPPVVEPRPAHAASQPSSASAESSADNVKASDNWYTWLGQMLAYFGIIALTAGTSGVVVSYFGGPAHYAPYGWLLATIGQMLLFLGIVTLISAGMDETAREVRQVVNERMDEMQRRFDSFDAKIVLLDNAHQEGPPRPHLLTPEKRRARQTESARGRRSE